MHEKGYGVCTDRETAMDYYMHAAMDCDYAPAIFHLGTMYLDGPKNGGFLRKDQKKVCTLADSRARACRL